MKGIFIYNPASGQSNVERELELCVRSLEERGWSADLVATQSPRHGTDIARAAADAGYDLAVAIGGDGTVSEVANGLVGSDTVMGVVPTGTTNVWALQLGIPSLPPWHPRKVVDRVLFDLEELGWYRPTNVPSWLADAFGVLLRSEIRAVDVGVVDGRHFLMWCGVGFDARVTEQVVPEDKRRYGVFAYLASTVSVAMEYTGARMHVSLGDRQLEEDVLMVLAANARLYGGVLQLSPEARLDDGLLDISVFKGEGVGSTVRHVTAVLAGRHRQEPQVEVAQVDRLSIASVPSQAVHADSEACGSTPVDITVKPRSLRVLVPPGRATDLFVHPPGGSMAEWE